jgi:Ser/Thr protein kinase RdoA (MazF antagonist)
MSSDADRKKAERFERSRERALHPEKALRLLRETITRPGWSCEQLLAIRIVKLWPGRRLTVKYHILGGQERSRTLYLYGKLFRGRRGAGVHARHRWLYQQRPAQLDVPEPLGYHARRRFLLMAELPGGSLAEWLAAPERVQPPRELLDQVGALLAALHSLRPGTASRSPVADPVPEFETHAGAEEVEILKQAAGRVAAGPWSRPTRARFERLWAEIVRRLAAPDSGPRRPWGVIHRDLYPQQIIVGRARCGLIDLDEAAVGPGELDVGNLLAHLILAETLQFGESTAAAWPRLGQGILDGYRARRDLDRASLTAFLCASLLRLASLERLAGPAARDGDWERLAGRLLSECARVLETPGPPLD